ncbi:MAG: ABC transporter substrate-binding protein [Janthinobacterium lividum]
MNFETRGRPARRRLLSDMVRCTAALTTLIFGTTTFAASASDAPVAIGLLLSKQGVFSETGQQAARGAMLAVDDVGGKVLGRAVKVDWFDDPDPQTAQQNMSKLIDTEQVVAVVGGASSSSALAEAAVAKRSKIPLVVVTGSAQEITGKQCNRYTFRTFMTVPVASRALAPALLKKGKRWYFIASNYAFGQEAYAAMKQQLVQAGGEEVAYDKLPLGTSDFSSFILKIRQAKPDAVMFALTGNDIRNFVQQYVQYGMKDKIPLGDPVLGESTIWSLDKDSLTGLYAKQWQYNDPANSSEEKQFATRFRAKYGEEPSVVSWDGWMSMRAVLSAIDQGKSTNAASIVHQLETISWHDRSVPTFYRAWDHQLIHQVLVVNARAPGKDKWDTFDIIDKVPANAADIDAFYGKQADSECKLGEL